jgi:putative transposase
MVRRLHELVEQIAGKHGWQIVAKEVMRDQVHLFVRVGPTYAPSQVVSAFEARIGRILRQEFPDPRGSANPSWSPSYFAASVGCLWESTVRRDTEHRWDAEAS